MLDGSSLSAREAAEELAERCHAEVVQVIGRKFRCIANPRAGTSREDQARLKANDRRANHLTSLRVPKYFGHPFLSLDQHAVEPPLHQALV